MTAVFDEILLDAAYPSVHALKHTHVQCAIGVPVSLHEFFGGIRTDTFVDRCIVLINDRTFKAMCGLHPLGWTGVMPFNWPSAGRVPLQT